MYKPTFDEIKDINLRSRAKLAYKRKTWSTTSETYIKLRTFFATQNIEEHPQTTQEKQLRLLWYEYKDYSLKHRKLKAELTKYMKKYPTVHRDYWPRLESNISNIVSDLVAVQQEFEVWKKEVEEVLK